LIAIGAPLRAMLLRSTDLPTLKLLLLSGTL
jgi:hypothetical protein